MTNEALKTVDIRSTLDGTLQKALFFSPRTEKPNVPLVIGLHQWSYSFEEQFNGPEFFRECHDRNWAFIYPNFRGPNKNPQACASGLAQQDILDAIEFARHQMKIDERKIYLIGASGGGHMALMMAGLYPAIWAAVSVWVPIVDIAAWYIEGMTRGTKYPAMLEKCCGGSPGDSRAVDDEFQLRSPVNYLQNAAGISIEINVGIHDGHTGSVPVSHSLRAFNILARATGCEDMVLLDEDINFITKEELIPGHLRDEKINSELGRKHSVLFQRVAGSARITIFDGAHDIDVPTAFRWFDKQTAQKYFGYRTTFLAGSFFRRSHAVWIP